MAGGVVARQCVTQPLNIFKVYAGQTKKL